MIAKTKEMKQISKDINDLSVKYQTIISKMFVDLSKINSDGKWVGNSADTFVNRVMEDKKDYVKIGDRIKDFSKLILNHANAIETKVSQVMEDENNG